MPIFDENFIRSKLEVTFVVERLELLEVIAKLIVESKFMLKWAIIVRLGSLIEF